MSRRIRIIIPSQTVQAVRNWVRSRFLFLCALLLLPVAAHAQSGPPFDTGFSNMQTLFTGTVAKVASLRRDCDRRLSFCIQ
jgi:type IV secretory pathway VirB2 component (pilin)